MKQGLSLRMSQHLALTPQLQQSIRLLQLSTLELSQEIEQMLDDNPFLEVETDDPLPGDDGSASPAGPADAEEEADAGFDEAPADSGADMPSWDTEAAPDNGVLDGIDAAGDGWGGDDGAAAAASGAARDDDEVQAADLASLHVTLAAHLHRQALALRLSEEDGAALGFLIESLDADGWLADSIDALVQQLAGTDAEAADELRHRFTVALRLLQSLDPAGVGARSLAECLQLQIRALDADAADPETRALALRLCALPLELLARRDLRRLAQLTCASESSLRDALALIARLDPKPGRRFADVERNIIVPDVIVTRSGQGAAVRLRVMLNPDVLPRLRVHDVYASALKAHRGEGHQALQQRLQEARWFIKNVQQRFDTILRVSQAIVERQKNFFIHGELAMRPLVLREIADELGLHESTISRVTTAKYMATPFGTYELKYFFGSSLGTETGGNASSTAVRALIRQFVAAENPARPLSDSQIADMLKEQGIDCARRTVAKYREALKIAPANLRRSL